MQYSPFWYIALDNFELIITLTDLGIGSNFHF